MPRPGDFKCIAPGLETDGRDSIQNPQRVLLVTVGSISSTANENRLYDLVSEPFR